MDNFYKHNVELQKPKTKEKIMSKAGKTNQPMVIEARTAIILQ